MTAAASVPSLYNSDCALHYLFEEKGRQRTEDRKKEEVDGTRLQDGGAGTCGPPEQVEPAVALEHVRHTHSVIRATRTVLPRWRVTPIRPAASNSRNALSLVYRLTPHCRSRPLGTGNSRDRFSNASHTSQIQTIALRVLVALAAALANHSGSLM